LNNNFLKPNKRFMGPLDIQKWDHKTHIYRHKSFTCILTPYIYIPTLGSTNSPLCAMYQYHFLLMLQPPLFCFPLKWMKWK
jgi:hypothetical protein